MGFGIGGGANGKFEEIENEKSNWNTYQQFCNSLWPGDVIIGEWIGSPSIKVMVWRLFDTKLLFESLMTCNQLHPSAKFGSKQKKYLKDMNLNMLSANVDNFIQAAMW